MEIESKKINKTWKEKKRSRELEEKVSATCKEMEESKVAIETKNAEMQKRIKKSSNYKRSSMETRSN